MLDEKNSQKVWPLPACLILLSMGIINDYQSFAIIGNGFE